MLEEDRDRVGALAAYQRADERRMRANSEVRCLPEHLNLGRNEDRKTTLSERPRRDDGPAVRARVTALPTIQARITALMRALPYTPIPRDAIRTSARTRGRPDPPAARGRPSR